MSQPSKLFGDPAETRNVIWTPQPGPQYDFVTCPFRECMYGGAAGGGKTDALLGDYSGGIEQYGEDWIGVLFRRSYPELEEVERRAMQIFSPIYGQDAYKRGRRTWEFPTAKGTALLRLRAMQELGDELKHQGHQYSWIGFDELTQWPTDRWLEYLLTRLRSAGGAPCFVRLASNPGNVGHAWVKKRYKIGEVEPRTPMAYKAKRSGRVHHRIFIPAKLSDNVILTKNDPNYEDQLDNISDPVLRRALRDGDWNVFAGQAFQEFNVAHHVIPWHKLPRGVPVRRTLDWGFSHPYGCLWGYTNYDGQVIIFRELYGQGERANEGTREAPEQVRKKIAEIEKSLEFIPDICRLDPQVISDDESGTSIYDRLGGIKMKWEGWAKYPGSRVAQKQEIHDLLAVVNGVPRLLIMDNCPNLIRTIMGLPISPRDPEDVDSNAEDHLYDALRGLVADRIRTRNELDAMRMRRVIANQERSLHRQNNPYGGH